MSTISPNAKAPPSPSTAKPIDLLQTQSSLFYANVHPSLLLLLLLFSFKPLVRDPVNTLLGLTPLLGVIQATRCVLCLPCSGRAPATAPKPGEKRKVPKPGQELWAGLVPAFLSLLLSLTLTAPALYIIFVLFGAPLTTHLPHTLLLAVHLALLTTPQLFYTHGLDPKTWFKIASLQLPVDELYGMSIGACVGSWIGAIPIPLDWDREWQKWPVTIVVGMYAGAVLGKMAGGHLFKGSKINLS